MPPARSSLFSTAITCGMRRRNSWNSGAWSGCANLCERCRRALELWRGRPQNRACMPLRRRFLHPLWLLASLPGYIGWRLLPALDLGSAGIVAGIAALLAACLIIPLTLRARSMRNRRFADRLAWVGLIAMGFLSSLFIVTLLRDVLLLVAH